MAKLKTEISGSNPPNPHLKKWGLLMSFYSSPFFKGGKSGIFLVFICSILFVFYKFFTFKTVRTGGGSTAITLKGYHSVHYPFFLFRTLTLLILVGLISAGCSSSVRFASGDGSSQVKGYSDEKVNIKTGEKLFGKASYYADFHNGRKTSNGEIFDSDKLTAAHKTLPFGTKVRVTNLKNRRQVNVTINDRGPFKEGRIIDLSRAAAEKLDMIRDGVADVEVEILDTP